MHKYIQPSIHPYIHTFMFYVKLCLFVFIFCLPCLNLHSDQLHSAQLCLIYSSSCFTCALCIWSALQSLPPCQIICSPCVWSNPVFMYLFSVAPVMISLYIHEFFSSCPVRDGLLMPIRCLDLDPCSISRLAILAETLWQVLHSLPLCEWPMSDYWPRI